MTTIATGDVDIGRDTPDTSDEYGRRYRGLSDKSNDTRNDQAPSGWVCYVAGEIFYGPIYPDSFGWDRLYL